jgi:hypothetical protein
MASEDSNGRLVQSVTLTRRAGNRLIDRWPFLLIVCTHRIVTISIAVNAASTI